MAVAARGGAALYLVISDGRGTLTVSEPIPLPGAVTAMAAGDAALWTGQRTW